MIGDGTGTGVGACRSCILSTADENRSCTETCNEKTLVAVVLMVVSLGGHEHKHVANQRAENMKPVDQTTFGYPHGNCFSACVASLLELPIDAVPFFMGAGDDWYEKFSLWLSFHGKGFYPVGFKLEKNGLGWTPAGLHILTGKSPRGDFLHSVVARGRSIVHDPHPDRTGLMDRQDVILIVPHDPAWPI